MIHKPTRENPCQPLYKPPEMNDVDSDHLEPPSTLWLMNVLIHLPYCFAIWKEKLAGQCSFITIFFLIVFFFSETNQKKERKIRNQIILAFSRKDRIPLANI
jgi:hypothetical protein